MTEMYDGDHDISDLDRARYSCACHAMFTRPTTFHKVHVDSIQLIVSNAHSVAAFHRVIGLTASLFVSGRSEAMQAGEASGNRWAGAPRFESMMEELQEHIHELLESLIVSLATQRSFSPAPARL